MVKFDLRTKWLYISGENLTGKDLAIVLAFLLVFIAILVHVFGTIELPKVQFLY